MSVLYQQAADILQAVLDRKGGLKSLAYDEKVSNKRSSYALVCQTMKYKRHLDVLLENVNCTFEMKKMKPRSLGYIVLYDLLIGRGKITGGGHVKKVWMKHSVLLKSALVDYLAEKGVKTVSELLPKLLRTANAFPRYARVNTLQISTEKVLELFKSSHPEMDISSDVHIPNLLLFPPKTELHEHELVINGSLILQDKASCFPAYVLRGQETSVISGDTVDACAAPGNKTSHLAMLVHSKNSKDVIFAFDRSVKRLDLLKKRMKEASADRVESVCQDFLSIDVTSTKYQNVTSILLDPSCSGSGMSNRLDHVLDFVTEEDEEITVDYCDDRITQLAEFQFQALCKAFTFPNVKRISYSTCSIFAAENERVVEKALAYAQKEGYSFELRKALPTWERRGIADKGLSEEQRECVLRTDAHEDNTNGFFVALFVHTSEPKPSMITDAQRERRKRKRSAQKKNRTNEKKGKVDNE